MKINENTMSRLVLKETAGCIWIFGLFFVIISMVVIAGLLGMFTNLNETTDTAKAAAWLVSLSALSAGLWIIYSNPVIYLCFDININVISIHRRGFLRNETEEFPLNEIEDIHLIESRDSDDDPIYQVQIKLKDGNKRLLTNSGPHNREALLESIRRIQEFL
jgi:hypothetical protein